MYVSSERDYKIPEKIMFVEAMSEEKKARDQLQVHIRPSRNEVNDSCSRKQKSTTTIEEILISQSVSLLD
jgi:hypothetical protein